LRPKIIQKLIDQFVKFPTVGPRTAARFVFYLINLPEKETKDIAELISSLKENIKICPLCHKSFERNGDENLCPICSDKMRDKSTIAVVEKEIDLEAIEKTKKYKGLYFILGGTIPNIKDEQKKQDVRKRIEELIKRVKNDNKIKEIILALNPTTEGEITALLIEREIKKEKSLSENLDKIKITKLGKGLPVGGELEYADEQTLSSAFENRK